ncbi:MAG: hypothetical protein HYZ26_12890 [Chloroflexi bacterium]|nr:hypothetical protein [Chloroflexota bacterium]
MRKIFLAIAVLSILAAAFAPLNKTVSILVHNNRETDVKVTMDGPAKYVFTVSPGWFEKVVEVGKYKITYEGCLGKVELEVEYTTAGQILDIEYCPPPPELAKFVVYSHFEEPLSITLTSLDPVYGEDYKLTTELGANRYYQIQTGDYIFSYDVCDTTFTGTIRILKNGTSSMTIVSCERLIYQDYEQPNPVGLRINNYYGSQLDVTLIGPTTYFFSLQPGFTRVEVISGIYTYIYAWNGVRYEGAIAVAKSGSTTITFPVPLSARDVE